MSTKAELIAWDNACQAFDREDFEAALIEFDQIADSSKIHFNIGVTLAAVQEHGAAINAYVEAINADQYFALAYFQKGVASFLLGNFEEAVEDFSNALLYLRGNLLIDYQQLGLDYKLYSSEVLYNRGLCFLFMEDDQSGAADLYAAQKEKQTVEHEIIDTAIEEGIEGLSVFSLPPGLIYRPPAGKVKNSGKMAHMGQSKLVAASSATDMYIGFKGSYERKINTITVGDNPSAAPASMRSRPVSPKSPVFPDRGKPYSQLLTRRPTDAGAKGKGGLLAGQQTARRTSSVRLPASARGRPQISRSYSTSRATPTPPRANPPRMPRRMTEASDLHPPRRGPDTSESGDDASSFDSYYGSTEEISCALFRVKCHFTDTRVIACDAAISFEELSEKIQKKFASRSPLKLKYKDEDQELVILGDDDDFALAKTYSGKDDKLDVWCFDSL